MSAIEVLENFTPVCRTIDLVPERGAAALLDGVQVALFRLDMPYEETAVTSIGAVRVFAVANRDPFTGANVLARGIVGEIDGRRYIASPLHKQRFDLENGVCLDDPSVTIPTWPTVIDDGMVLIGISS